MSVPFCPKKTTRDSDSHARKHENTMVKSRNNEITLVKTLYNIISCFHHRTFEVSPFVFVFRLHMHHRHRPIDFFYYRTIVISMFHHRTFDFLLSYYRVFTITGLLFRLFFIELSHFRHHPVDHRTIAYSP